MHKYININIYVYKYTDVHLYLCTYPYNIYVHTPTDDGAQHGVVCICKHSCNTYIYICAHTITQTHIYILIHTHAT